MVTRLSWMRRIGFLVLILAILFFCLFPFLQMLATSLTYPEDLGDPSFFPKRVNLESYKELLNIGQGEKTIPPSIQQLLEGMEPEERKAILDRFLRSREDFSFLRYLGNSFYLAAGAALASVIVSILGAYSFSRLRYPGRPLVRRGVLLVYMFGGILLLIPLYRMAASVGLLATRGGTIVALLVTYMVQTLPVSLYMLGNFFRTIPFSVEEAAMIEGANRFTVITRVIVPLSFSAIVTVFIYAFMIAWNEYLFASVFLREYRDLHTLPLWLKAFFVTKNVIWDRIMAASMLTATPVILFFMAIQKNLTGGLSEGGVKE